MPAVIEKKNMTRREILEMMSEKEKLEQQLKTLTDVLQSVDANIKFKSYTDFLIVLNHLLH